MTGARADLERRVAEAWSALAPIGRRAEGGYDRFSWTEEDARLRAWFRAEAEARGLVVEADRNTNLWAWWPAPPRPGDPGAIATGSHLDSVPSGGAFDGPLGVVSGLLALDVLAARRRRPPRPVAVVVFAEEEGARFGVACLGSRLSTGAYDPARARELVDARGTRLADALGAAGGDPDGIGADGGRLASLECFVELHLEQGRALEDLGAAVGVATGIWPHGRWRLRFEGEADHAGTATLSTRRDPMLPFAATVSAARTAAVAHGGRATVGRAEVRPNATNAVPATVDAWLDARAPADDLLEAIVADVRVRAESAAADHAVKVSVTEESTSSAVAFDPVLRRRMVDALGGAPELGTGAGHDAGVLAAHLPTGMLFVRNPTGVSHSPAELARPEDCVSGVLALARVLETLWA